MATDPRIRYDIEARASGAADVEKLAREFEQLDGAFPEDLAAKVRVAAQALGALGQEQEAVEAFRRVRDEAAKAGKDFDAAKAAVEKLAKEIAQSEAPTRAQVGQLEKLRDKVKDASAEFERQERSLDKARNALTQFGVTEELIDRRSELLKRQIASVSAQIDQLGKAGGDAQEFRKLVTATEDARLAFASAGAELASFEAKMARVDEPTATEALALRRLSDRLEETRVALEAAGRAQQDGARSFAAAGGSVDDFTASIRAARSASLESAEASRTDAEARLRSARAAAQAAREQAAAEREAQAAANSAEAVFARLVKETDAARLRMEQTARAADSLAAELAAVQRPTDGEAAKLRDLRAAADSARGDFQRLQQATVEQGVALRQAGANTELLTARARESAAAQSQAATAAQRVTNAYSEQGAAASRSAQQQATAATSVRGSLEGIAGQLRSIQALAGAVLGGQILSGQIGDLARTADAYANLEARIKLVTGEGAALQQAFSGVFDVALRTNSAVESTGTLFARIAQAQRDIGASTSEATATALALTETINQAIQVSGGSAQAADAAITQLIQGLQSGVLRGEEFNSVMEQAPRLARALADGLGVTTGELRKLAEAGTFTSQTVISALRGQSAALQQEFEQLPPTVGRALTTLLTEWTRYVGEVDRANGISRTAAEGITALAQNLDTVGAALLAAGKAGAAYVAIDLAKSLYARAAAAAAASAAQAKEATTTAAATVTLAANTAALAENTTAKAANAAASGASALAWGTLEKNLRLGGTAAVEATKGVGALGAAFGLARGAGGAFLSAIGGLPTVLLAVILNAKELGTWLGESAAKMLGAKDRSEELAAAELQLAEETRRVAAEKAAQAQRMQQAAAAALGLTDASKRLVAEFDGLIKKGESVSDALGKISKDLELGNLTGIRDAITALDALAQQGKITGDQVRESLAAALKGEDLSNFKIAARAAFDESEQGARRFAQALAAIDTEALRRAGTSAEELRTGFSRAATSAVNDIDAIVAAVGRLGVAGDDAQRAIAKALDAGTDAAGTRRAIDDMIARITALGEAGTLTGKALEDSFLKAINKSIEFGNTERDLKKVEEQIKAIIAANPQMALAFEGALDKLKQKLIEVSPYLRQLQDDAKKLGVQLSESASKGTEDAIRSYERLKASGKLTTGELTTAFVNLAKQAIEAAGGQIPEWVKVEAAMRGVTVGTDAAGRAIIEYGQAGVSAMNNVSTAIQSQIGSLSSLTDAAKKANQELSVLGKNMYDAQGFALDSSGNRINITGQLNIPDGYTLDTQAFLRAQQSAAQSGLAAPDPKNFIVSSGGNIVRDPASIYGKYQGQEGYGSGAGYSPFNKKSGSSSASSGGNNSSSVPAGATTVNINLNGRQESVQVVGLNDSVTLERVLRSLWSGARSSGWT